MKIIGTFIDDQYPNIGHDHLRVSARAIVINDLNQIALTHIQADDHFGHRDYYELPGGGVHPNESIYRAVQREIIEELGFETRLVAEIGEVHDFYNLIKQENRSLYFILKCANFCGNNLQPRESRLIKEIIWVTLKDALTLYENMQDELVGRLVKQRELPVLREALLVLKEKTEQENISH
ncbi:MAG: NUDIX hydrolase [Bacilli bacterium]|jgi:8-oxo-dGTP pyrophosphatase MutT (NUDIX family)|nr:NUDIX hydrolase [Bacilli bacterium]MDD3389662.1 NUDIX hydrolase [Bacilli bacterium]MDD4345277.1 NUDIX hydrolase [Bacilli bacterium]MDD4521334.1 NUDIX hydrolase [Bacilli bacterium]MDY0400064.1 NUDIX hydrolase [Bacilli bacterium]